MPCNARPATGVVTQGSGRFRPPLCRQRAGHFATLSAGVAVDASDYDRRTALHLAAAEGRVAVVMKLCEHGADIRFRDRWGHDAIDAATGGGHADLVAQLHLLEKH